MSHAPQVLVIAPHGAPDERARILDAVAGQTYRQTKVLFFQRGPRGETSRAEDAPRLTSEADLAAQLKKSRADMVLFWPDDGEPRKAAIEKLVLALQLAPDQDGVADAARGESGFWLGRCTGKMAPLLSAWLGSPLVWLEKCRRVKPAFFFLPENLMDTANPTHRRRYAIGTLFGKLPLRLQNYQPIPTEPVWDVPAEAPDDQSVLFIVSSLPMGGACKFILDIAGELQARGRRVTVATTAFDLHNPNRWLDALLRIIPDVFVLSNGRPVDIPRQIAHLARTRRCGRIVISHSMLGYQLLPWLRCELPGVAFLDYTHIEHETEWPDGGYALRSVQNQGLLDLSMVSSNHLAGWMRDRGADRDTLRVCHTNIDPEKWKPNPEARDRVRRELGIKPGTAMILYPCRLAEQKRPELMCNIVAALRRATRLPFVAVVAGDGPLMPALRKFVEKQGLGDCFQLLGAVPLERVAELHNAADIFFLPSLIEGIALALFEAMALETVPVVGDVGGQRELVTPECGYLVPLGDLAREAADYVRALKQLIENPERRREMARAGRTRVLDHFPLSEMTSNFIAALEAAGERRMRRSIALPDAAICREMAALAIDHIRVTYEGSLLLEQACLLHQRMTRQEKANLKLQRQIEALRAQAVREENAFAC